MRKQLSRDENKGSVGTLARGLDILELFAGDSPELTQTEISERLGLPVPTVHRLVKLLIERGWLVRDAREPPPPARARRGSAAAGGAAARPRPRPAARDGGAERRDREPGDARRRRGPLPGERDRQQPAHAQVARGAAAAGARHRTRQVPARAARRRGRAPRRGPRALPGPDAAHGDELGKAPRAARARPARGRGVLARGVRARAPLDRRAARLGGGRRAGGGERLAAVVARGPGGHGRAHARAARRGRAESRERHDERNNSLLARRPLRAEGRARGRRRGRGVRDRRRRGRAVLRAPAGAARHRDGAARGRDGRGRRERAQRRLPDRRRGAPSTTTPASSYGAERARAMYARTLEAQRDIYELAAELGAGDALRQVGLLRLAVSEEEAEHVRDHAARPAGRTASRARSSSASDLPPALQAHRPRGVPHRPRRRPPPRALVPAAGRSRGGGGRAHLRGQRGARARARAGRGPGGHGARQRARAARGRGRRRRAAGARAGVRRTGALAPAAHGGHRAAAPDARPAGLRALGLRVPPAAPRRAHPRGRLQRRGRATTRTRTATPAARRSGSASRRYLREDLGARPEA